MKLACIDYDGVLADGMQEQLRTLAEETEYYCLYLSSRYEAQREDVLTWLYAHEFPAFRLAMRPVFVKPTVPTALWKSDTILFLAALWGAEEVLVIDTNESLATLLKATDGRLCQKHHIWCVPSLDAALDTRRKEGRYGAEETPPV